MNTQSNTRDRTKQTSGLAAVSRGICCVMQHIWRVVFKKSRVLETSREDDWVYRAMMKRVLNHNLEATSHFSLSIILVSWRQVEPARNTRIVLSSFVTILWSYAINLCKWFFALGYKVNSVLLKYHSYRKLRHSPFSNYLS
jgi:hypothetical protein